MSWGDYINKSLLETGKITNAAIASREGTSVWASNDGFSLGLDELKILASGFDDPTQILGSGFYLSGKKYVAIRVEGRSIYGKQGSESVYCVQTGKTIIIACFHKTTQTGEAVKIVETLSDYLISVGF
ncbi:unnamed protein product [Pneumocystis jirovecii]|uniref:Profilin n=2 Tax=Pneumocystis jirovecii TaxID=42068 RepID=L0P9B7_PNEJI|nr:profilin [Pneumocystis jirovecii RU7]KTW31204.1 hypothetical protein T551_01277 [Pneumocystis jirovecii RU7]CCJ28689.1 unnamed protein product [Pneumocystis jirovecii]CCJ29963.1 unnamed protein product [Pneumocystis jirovecii]